MMVEMRLSEYSDNILEFICTDDSQKIGEFHIEQQLLELEPVTLDEINVITELLNRQMDYYSNVEPKEIEEA